MSIRDDAAQALRDCDNHTTTDMPDAQAYRRFADAALAPVAKRLQERAEIADGLGLIVTADELRKVAREVES